MELTQEQKQRILDEDPFVRSAMDLLGLLFQHNHPLDKQMNEIVCQLIDEAAAKLTA